VIVAVASGKGGTGKTTISANLAKSFGGEVQLLDCDVEEPNAHLFLKGTAVEEEEVPILVPEVDEALCDGCGECGAFCRFHAIVSFGAKPLVFPDLCHGCGGCVKVCQKKAIREKGRRIGVVGKMRSDRITLIHGRLDVGAPMSPPLIRAVKARMRKDLPAILDAPPGTSCPVIATIGGADFVLLVTEPTPFGLNALMMAVDMVRDLRIPCAVAVNRTGAGDDRVHAYCLAQGIPILLEIPEDREIAECYSRGELIVESLPRYRPLFEGLARRLRETIRSLGIHSPERPFNRSCQGRFRRRENGCALELHGKTCCGLDRRCGKPPCEDEW
jgi:MinD superfamily P-loop ATPase